MPNYPYIECASAQVDVHGIRTHYYMAGQPNGRPPVILLHGTSASGDSFRETMHELAEDHWLIAPDIPGFGFSEMTTPYIFQHLVEWMAAFKEALHLPKSVIMGHSFGGMLATTFALSYPEDVAGLVLIAPAVLVIQSLPELPVKLGISLGLVDFGSAMTQKQPILPRVIRTPFFETDSVDDSVWGRRTRDYENARASAHVIKALASYDARPYLPKMQTPVVMVWGENDAVVPASNAKELNAYWPQAEVHVLPACGHVPMVEKQSEFQQIARDFMAAL